MRRTTVALLVATGMCAGTAFGVLKIAAATGDEQLRKGVEDTFRPELLEGRNPHRDNAHDRPPHQWFGFVPLSLYQVRLSVRCSSPGDP